VYGERNPLSDRKRGKAKKKDGRECGRKRKKKGGIGKRQKRKSIVKRRTED